EGRQGRACNHCFYWLAATRLMQRFGQSGKRRRDAGLRMDRVDPGALGCRRSSCLPVAPIRPTAATLAALRSPFMIRRLLLGLAVVLAASNAMAADYTVGSIEVDQPWSRATPKGAKVASGYLKIRNAGSAPDRLLGGTFAPSGSVELHEMSMEGAVMKMRETKGGLEIK